MRLALILFVTGCGRVAFDDLRDAPTDMFADASADALQRARPVLVQEQAGQAGSMTSFTLPFGMPVRAGSTVVVATLNHNVGGRAAATLGISDDAGNLYTSTSARATWTGTEGQAEIWYARDTLAGATQVTVSSAASTTRSVWLLELANVDTEAPLHATGVISDGVTGSMPAAPTATASAAPAAIVSVILLTGAVTQVAAGSEFQSLPLLSGDAAAYAIIDTPGTYGAVWDAPGSDNYASSTAAFLGAD